jgi:hypothetical protein
MMDYESLTLLRMRGAVRARLEKVTMEAGAAMINHSLQS